MKKETKARRFDSVEDYLASLDSTKAETLRSVIGCILGRFPELECKISWNVPQIHRNGEYVFGMSALKNHLTLAPWSLQVIENFKVQMAGYVVKMHCFQVPVDWEVDTELLENLVRARLAELDSL